MIGVGGQADRGMAGTYARPRTPVPATINIYNMLLASKMHQNYCSGLRRSHYNLPNTRKILKICKKFRFLAFDAQKFDD